MSEQDKRQTPREIKELRFAQPDRKKFEVLYQSWTPYKRLGSWLQFIWRW